MVTEVHAEQISVEAAAKAAGVAVETGTATVNGVSIYYRDIGPPSAPVILLLSRNRRRICVSCDCSGYALSSPCAGFAWQRPVAASFGRLREEDTRDRYQGVDGSSQDLPRPRHWS